MKNLQVMLMLDDFYWREAWWLLLSLLPWGIILLRYLYQRKIWLKIADQHLLPWVKTAASVKQNQRPGILLAVAWLFFSIALAGPRTPQWIPPALQSEDAVMVIVDFSTSMLARDGINNRIVQAQQLLTRWLHEQYESSARKVFMGLIIFSGQSHTLLIPTDDHVLFQHFITQLDQFRPPTLGNNLAASLQSASELIKNSKGNKSIILLSDGDLGEQALSAALTIASKIKRNKSLKLSVIGVGRYEAVTIPLSNGPLFSLDDKLIVSRRETLQLQQLAETAGGRYFKAESIATVPFEQLISLSNPRIAPQLISRIVWHEWFFIALIIGLFFTFIALQHFTIKVKAVLSVTIVLLLAGCNKNSTDNPDYNAAFLEGVNCYQVKEYVCAQQYFAYAAWAVNDKLLRGRAIFNLANSHFKLGDYELAGILFKDAEYHGVAIDKTRINREFADSLALAVKQRLRDIAKIRQHAQWRTAAPALPDGFADMLSDGLFLTAKTQHFLAALSVEEQKLLLKRGVQRKLSQNNGAASTAADAWVSSQQDKIAQSSAGLFNRLMPVESGLHYVPDSALTIEGVRPW